jgi:hypothetical protein
LTWEGISDITSTEGDLRNYTRICGIIGERVIEKKVLVAQIKDNKEIHRKSDKVIERHLSILSKLGVIESEMENGRELFRLLPNGKILYQYSKEIESTEKSLSKHERLFYFRLLLTGNTLPQLAILLYTVENNEGLAKDELVFRYYKNYLKSHLRIWKRESLDKRLRDFETNNKMKRSERNRFDCMIQWLKSLRLVNSNALMETGKKFLQAHPILDIQSEGWWFDYQQKVSDDIFYFAKQILETQSFRNFDINSEKDNTLFLKYVKEAMNLFGNKSTGTLNSLYLTDWAPCELLLHENVYCSKTNVKTLIENLYSKKIILSVMAGDYKNELNLLRIAEDNS